MPITTIKHCQTESEYWFTVSDRDQELDGEQGSSLVIKYHDDRHIEGRVELAVGREDALLIRDAINQLFPPSD